MKNKTAMQIAFNKYQEYLTKEGFAEWFDANVHELLEKEKKQIKKAFDDGFLTSEKPEDYFTQTYHQ